MLYQVTLLSICPILSAISCTCCTKYCREEFGGEHVDDGKRDSDEKLSHNGGSDDEVFELLRDQGNAEEHGTR